MTRKLNKKGIIAIIISAILLIILLTIVVYFSKLSAPTKKDEKIEFVIEKGNTYTSIAKKLKEQNLIKSQFAYKIYIKLNKPQKLNACKYELNKNMSVKELVNTLSSGKCKEESMKITFKEGLNIKQIATLIEQNTNYKADDVFNLLKNEDYINKLISDYWFITDEIKDNQIYYPIEGYLFPDTYEFKKDSTLEEIFKVLLDQMDKELSKYKSQIESSELTVHELLTLASIVELEAGNSAERNGVAAVFYNRINDGWTLGSDVTTYYAEQKPFTEDLLLTELNECNAYNTRGNCFQGLPVGPISNPSRQSIEGVMNPTQSEYYYFVADKTGKTYFNTTASGHQQTIDKLKREGLWYIYE